jgi:capping protein alpha
VGAHYYEEGNVQLDAKHECKDATIFQVIAISTSPLA